MNSINQSDVVFDFSQSLTQGAGKSLCYQLPAVMFAGITLVVSPLLALIGNQIGHLRALGIEAHSLNSSISELERKEIIADLEAESPRCRLLYVTPELMAQQHFSRRLVILQKYPLSLAPIPAHSHSYLCFFFFLFLLFFPRNKHT